MSQSERRLAAVMFTDMVGYTALGQKDESLSLAVVEAQQRLLRPVLARHGGREVKTMGDAFLVEFTSAIEAVRCAYDIQRSVREFNLTLSSEKRVHIRVGIHLGEVVEKDGDIFGDAVNVASRIEPLAEDGGVCLTQQVYDHVHNKFEIPLVSKGKMSLKNVSEQVEVYRMAMPWDEEKVVSPTQLDRNRIAVLPFTNMSSDPEDAFFADGLTEEMITELSGLKGLGVIARTSVMHYKNTEKSIKEIARDLGVRSVLEGSVRKAGNKIRITAQLIDAMDEEHLWAQRFDRELKDIFEVQSEVATCVAGALKVKLLDSEVTHTKKKHTESIEAYTLYLRGRTLWNRWDREGVLESLKLFQEAIRIDPNYAKAYSGLADAYAVAAENDFMSLADGYAKSKEAATKALELDDTLAEAHASLGVNLWHDLRFEEVHRELRRAIELNPSDALAHRWYSEFLLDLGRMKEATDEIMKACELDPFSPGFTGRLGVTYLLDGRLDEAIAICNKLIESEPTHASHRYFRASCFIRKGMKERALADLEAWHELARDEDAYKLELGKLNLWFGEREKASSMMDEFISKVGRPYIWEMDIAWCYAILGDKDGCFKWIDKAISAKRVYPASLRYSPAYDKMRDDPRFPEIFKKLGLPY